jgi:hypothetical protein
MWLQLQLPFNMAKHEAIHANPFQVMLPFHAGSLLFHQQRIEDLPPGYLLLVPRNFSHGRGVLPSLAEQEEQSCQHEY